MANEVKLKIYHTRSNSRLAYARIRAFFVPVCCCACETPGTCVHTTCHHTGDMARLSFSSSSPSLSADLRVLMSDCSRCIVLVGYPNTNYTIARDIRSLQIVIITELSTGPLSFGLMFSVLGMAKKCGSHPSPVPTHTEHLQPLYV